MVYSERNCWYILSATADLFVGPSPLPWRPSRPCVEAFPRGSPRLPGSMLRALPFCRKSDPLSNVRVLQEGDGSPFQGGEPDNAAPGRGSCGGGGAWKQYSSSFSSVPYSSTWLSNLICITSLGDALAPPNKSIRKQRG